jgi:hypothetical protein
MRSELSRRLGVEVMSYQITALDYINDMARIMSSTASAEPGQAPMNDAPTPTLADRAFAHQPGGAQRQGRHAGAAGQQVRGARAGAGRGGRDWPVFDVLEIDGQRSFTYETCYFDDPSAQLLRPPPGPPPAHEGAGAPLRGRRLCFVEVKLKDKRGVTVKKRLLELQRVMEMRYRRTTLVAREGGERMTIDGGIEFLRGGRVRRTDADVFIVETKSANGNGLADRILRQLHQHPTNSCSKYCVGMAALDLVPRHNKFLPALRKLNAMPMRERATTDAMA